MSSVDIIWDPSGTNINSLGSNEFLRATDGDTPFVSINIRMLSIDTPEVHYPGRQKPAKQDQPLAQLGQWIRDGYAPIDPGLGEYLYPRLISGKAGSLHGQQGKTAAEYFKSLLEEKLTRPSGAKRRVFLRVSSEPFDAYGRLLAYMAPSYTKSELAEMPLKDRATFNLMLVDSGWAATFPIYPSLPKHEDLQLLHDSARTAYEEQRGAWKDLLTLTGYEYRMCVKLYRITERIVNGETLSPAQRSAWISRYCFDMTSRELFFPQDYYKVLPYNRVFIWPKDVTEAVGRLNLRLGG